MALYKFQQEAIAKMLKFLKTNETQAVLQASEMGTGKSLMSIQTIAELNCKSVLIICPGIVRLVWKNEIKCWDQSNPGISVILASKDLISANAKYVICSYDLCHKPAVLSKLLQQSWDCLVLDEAHMLRHRKTLRTRATLGNIWPKAKYKILLTGTPMATCLLDMYTLLHSCCPSVFTSYYAFAEEYCYKKYNHFSTSHVEYYGAKNIEKLSSIIRQTCFVRYTKAQALPELPGKIYQKIPLPIKYAVIPHTKDEQKLLEYELEKVKQAVASGKVPVIPKSIAEHRRLQGLAKVEPVSEFVLNLLEQGIPTVLFAWHKAVITKFKEIFKNYNPVIVTGESSAISRQDAVEQFQAGKTLLFIANIIAGGVGITLTKSSTVVLAEIDWVPANVEQAIDRTVRIGQTKAVNVYYSIVEDSLDESIYNVVLRRIDTFNKVLNGN